MSGFFKKQSVVGENGHSLNDQPKRLPENNHQSFDENLPFRMKIEDKCEITGRGTVVTGWIESGEIHAGQEVVIIDLIKPIIKKTVVVGIEKFGKILNEAKQGDVVGILLRGLKEQEVSVGSTLVKRRVITLALESYIIDSDTLRNHRDRESIESINLVYGLAVIKAYAFSEFKNLKSISIPASVERIESHAFSHCSSLKTVYYKGTKEQRKAMKIGSNDELTNAKWIYEPQPPDVRPEDGDRCPKCDGFIINGVCNRCSLDFRKR